MSGAPDFAAVVRHVQQLDFITCTQNHIWYGDKVRTLDEATWRVTYDAGGPVEVRHLETGTTYKRECAS